MGGLRLFRIKKMKVVWPARARFLLSSHVPHHHASWALVSLLHCATSKPQQVNSGASKSAHLDTLAIYANESNNVDSDFFVDVIKV